MPESSIDFDPAHFDPAQSIELDLDLRRAHNEVLEALCVLPRSERELFILGFWHGKSRSEIANELKLPIGTVASRLARSKRLFDQARRHLRADRPVIVPGRPWPAWAAPGRRAARVITLSRPWEQLWRHQYLVINNQWARARASGPFDQCLLVDDSSARPGVGWSWSWPKRPVSPYAFPHVVYGWSPWQGGEPTHPRWPIPLSKLGHFSVSYEVETRALGHHVLLLLVYLLRAPRRDGLPDPCAIAAELTIRLDHRGNVLTPGAAHGEPLIDGVQYRVMRAYTAGGPELLGYPAYVFQPRTPLPAACIHLSHLLEYLVQRRYIDTDLWVAGLELGNEISGGCGTSWLRRLAIDTG